MFKIAKYIRKIQYIRAVNLSKSNFKLVLKDKSIKSKTGKHWLATVRHIIDTKMMLLDCKKAFNNLMLYGHAEIIIEGDK